MIDLRGALTHDIGPLPAWGWGAMGGGALWLLSKYKANTAAATNANSGGLGLLPAPAVGTVTSDPTSGGNTTGGTSQPAETLGGLLGPLETFLQGVPNAPDNFALALPGGAAVSFSNGVPTFGNGLGLQPAPTVLNPGQTFVGGNPFWQFLGSLGINPPSANPTPPGGPITLPAAPPYTQPSARIGGVPTQGVPNPLPPGTRGLAPSGQTPVFLPGGR